MAALSTLALVGGLALGAAGSAMQYMGMQKQAKAQQHMAGAQQAAENHRQQAMQVDATRRTREAIRSSYLARGEALNAGGNSNSQFGSGIAGIEGNIATQTATNISGIQQNRSIGENIAGANAAYGAASAEYGAAGSDVAMGAGISSLGGALTKNVGSIGRLDGADVGKALWG